VIDQKEEYEIMTTLMLELTDENSANPSFQEAMDYVFEKNSELYRRLACLALA